MLMACAICGRDPTLHGSERQALAEFGCHDGVLMDDDTYCEGWQPDVVYPPCPYNPAACVSCQGTGEAPPVIADQDDCPDCKGTGWVAGKPRWPTPETQCQHEDMRSGQPWRCSRKPSANGRCWQHQGL
jgi:hypothetical protein